MKVFMSSVRKGLEQERDALPSLIDAIGHEAVRFEDFSAQLVPSREACLRALAGADVYLLILGPNYGHRFLETGQSPTHDEWEVATKRGMTRLVYRKQGVRFEDDQQEFARSVQDYATGVFYDTFETATELQSKVARKLRELAEEVGPLSYAPLRAPANVSWRCTGNQRNSSFRPDDGPSVGIHVTPVPQLALPTRAYAQLSESLLPRVRRSGVVEDGVAIGLQQTAERSSVDIPSGSTARWGEPVAARVAGVDLWKTGQVSARATLPNGGMGPMLDWLDMREQLSNLLLVVGSLDMVDSPNLAIGVELDLPSYVTSGRVGASPQRSASMIQTSGVIQVEPDETVTLAALGRGAHEASLSLSRALQAKFEGR